MGHPLKKGINGVSGVKYLVQLLNQLDNQVINMLFNTPSFIFLFLPVSFFVYFLLNRNGLFLAGKTWLVATSLFFYAYWNLAYLPILLGSIFFNFAVGTGFSKITSKLKLSNW